MKVQSLKFAQRAAQRSPQQRKGVAQYQRHAAPHARLLNAYDGYVADIAPLQHHRSRLH